MKSRHSGLGIRDSQSEGIGTAIRITESRIPNAESRLLSPAHCKPVRVTQIDVRRRVGAARSELRPCIEEACEPLARMIAADRDRRAAGEAKRPAAARRQRNGGHDEAAAGKLLEAVGVELDDFV